MAVDSCGEFRQLQPQSLRDIANGDKEKRLKHYITAGIALDDTVEPLK